MIGRVVVVEAIIHSIGYLVREKYHKKKDLASCKTFWELGTKITILMQQLAGFNKSTYAIWGAVAALCGVIILFQGTHAVRALLLCSFRAPLIVPLIQLRRLSYEIFLVLVGLYHAPMYQLNLMTLATAHRNGSLFHDWCMVPYLVAVSLNRILPKYPIH